MKVTKDHGSLKIFFSHFNGQKENEQITKNKVIIRIQKIKWLGEVGRPKWGQGQIL